MDNKDTSFAAMLAKVNPEKVVGTVKQVQTEGTPIFTVNDLRTTMHPLAQLARLFLIENGISREKFESLHRKRATDLCMATNNMNYERNNMRRALVQGEITWNFLEKLFLVCGFDLADIQLTLVEKESGEIKTLKRSDVMKVLQENPSPASELLKKMTHI